MSGDTKPAPTRRSKNHPNPGSGPNLPATTRTRGPYIRFAEPDIIPETTFGLNTDPPIRTRLWGQADDRRLLQWRHDGPGSAAGQSSRAPWCSRPRTKVPTHATPLGRPGSPWPSLTFLTPAPPTGAPSAGADGRERPRGVSSARCGGWALRPLGRRAGTASYRHARTFSGGRSSSVDRDPLRSRARNAAYGRCSPGSARSRRLWISPRPGTAGASRGPGAVRPHGERCR